MKLPKVLWTLWILLGCTAEAEPNRSDHDPKLTTLRAQRVTATVKRDAARLVRVATEREAFITTPEHPFAKLGSGWTLAERLVPGDRVMSAKFGAVRILAVQSEKPTHPTTVFNLSVEPSHAYLVGTDQVLVHNTGCKDGQDILAKKTEQISDAQRELARLEATTPTALDDKARLAQQIAELKSRITKLQANVRSIHSRAKKKASAPNAPKENALTRNTRKLEAVESEIETLTQAPAGHEAETQRLTELKKERRRLMHTIRSFHRAARLAGGRASLSLNERMRQKAEAAYENAKTQLEDKQKELPDVPGREPPSKAERSELERQIQVLQLDYESATQVLDWENRLAELDEHISPSDAEHAKTEQEKKDLRAKVSAELRRRSSRISERKRRAPEHRSSTNDYKRNWQRGARRSAAYVDDTQRAPDTLEVLEAELAARGPGADLPTRDERIEYLTERVQTLKELVDLRKRIHVLKAALFRAREERKELVSEQKDTKDIDAKLAGLEQKRTEARGEIAIRRAREAVFGRLYLEGAPGTPPPIDQARLTEIERELWEGVLDEAGLTQLEHEVRGAEALPAEFFEDIWREVEVQQGEIQQIVRDEAQDVEAAQRAVAETLEKIPSPEREAAAVSGLRALQNELREARIAVEAADFALANEYAFLSETLPRPGSSRHAESVKRLKAIQEQRMQLRTEWRERMQRRLEVARQQLRRMQSIAGSHDQATEAELARQIALLEHEVEKPAF